MGTKMNVSLLEGFHFPQSARHPSWVKHPVFPALCNVHYVLEEADMLVQGLFCTLCAAVLLAFLLFSWVCT